MFETTTFFLNLLDDSVFLFIDIISIDEIKRTYDK